MTTVHVRGTGTFQPSRYTKPDGTTTTKLEDPDMQNTRIDITGGVLKQYPAAVVKASQTEAGIFYEVRLPNRSIFPVRMMVEWGDDEAQCLDIILARLSGDQSR